MEGVRDESITETGEFAPLAIHIGVLATKNRMPEFNY